MRKPILLFLFVCAFQALLFSQALTGVKTIPGDYANLTAAFTALNSNGVGSGGVTFNVAAGSVFNERPPVLTVKGTAANPVVFQKSGSGNNPKVVPNSAGTLTPGTYYSHGDAIIRLSGARYVTFDGIDLEENTAYTTATEFSETGYNILKENATSGCKYITIKNCRIKLSSSLLTGTAILIADRNAAGSAVAASNKQGTFNNLKFYGITSDSICSGIMKYQSQSVFYDSLADDSLDIGVEGGNIFYAIGATVMNSTAFGVNVVSEWQKTVRIHNNTIIGRKNDWTGDTWGIMVSDMPGAKVSIQNNTIRDMRAYYSLRGISNAGGNNTGSSSNHVLIKNNSVRNCVYGPLGSGALIQSSSSAPFTIIQNNLIDSVTGNAAGNGIYCSTSPDSLLITGNTISNCSVSAEFSAIYSNNPSSQKIIIDSNYVLNSYCNRFHVIYIKSNSSSIIAKISRNTIKNLSSSDMYAIHTEWAGKIDINNNYLSNLTGKPVNGIYIFKEPASCNIYNNVIAGLYSDGGLLKYTISGITLAQPGTFGIYYNTIYLDDSTAIANDFSSCCLDIQFPSTVVDLRNNNFINISATGSTGKRTVLKCGWSYSIISSNSGYNNYYAGTPSSKNLISDLSNISTLAQYKAALYPKEQTSLTELPPFLNVSTHPYDVNLDPNTLTQLESQATPITSPISITTDFNFNTRSATMPDIGAYEGVFKGVDKTAPIISVPKFLSNGIIEPSRNLMNVTITDTSGVMRTSGASPRIYYKKYSEPNAYNGNTNAVSGWKWTEASAVNGNLYDFSIDYSLLKDTLAAGDTIQYFLVATDSAAALNTGTLGAILAGPATSVNLTSAHFPVTNLLYRYTIKGSMHGIVTVGNGGAFPSLTGNNGLFAAVNSSILTDDLTAKIISNTAETGAVGLQSLDKYDNNPYVFKIQPDSSKPYKLAGNVSGNAMIRIGAGRDIIIDGNYEDEGRYLHFENTSNASSSTVIQLGAQQGAAHFANGITIKNCLVSMPNTPANYANMGIQVTNYNPSTTGIEIQNITIENNHIYDAGMGIHVKGEYSSLKTIHNITIRKNQIGYYRGKGTIKINGIYLEYVDSVLIEANHIENISSDGIRLADHARNIKIYTNRISSFGLGLSTFGSSGIHAETGLANSNIEIINNFISDIKFVNVPFNGPGNSNGITVKSVGSSVTGNVKILHNSVRLEGTRPIGVQTAALHVLSGPPIDVRNNILYNTITNVGSSSSKSYGFISGYSFDTTVFAFDYNNIYTTSQGVTGTYKGQDRKTLSDLKASSSTHFQNSISCLPDFYSANDLRVSASCLANSGTPASVPTDIFGKPRSSVSPTIGAYEFIEYTDDIAVTDFIGDVECGTDSHKVTVIVRNVGLVEQSGFTIHLEITGDQTGSASYSYTDTLPSKQNDTVTITTGIASWAGMELDIMASVSLTGDANSSNDSLSHYYNIHAAPVLTTTGDTLCGGGAFSLSASSANSTINWYAGSTATTPVNTGTAFSPVVTATTKYYLVATDTAWQCTSPLDSVYAVVLAIDTVKLGADTNACAGDSINLGQDKTYPAYLWSTGDTTSSITAIVQGIYWLQVTDNNGCISSDTMMVNLSTDCVWPGDATNNGVANIIDILEIALHYNRFGLPRPNATILWDGQWAPDWNDTLNNGQNLKFADCNGDSIINLADIAAVVVNYGMTHNKTGGTIEGQPGDIPLYLEYANDTVAPGDSVTAHLMLGEQTSPINVYGMAFTLAYPPQVQPGSMSLDVNSSWLFTTGDEKIGVKVYVPDSVSEDFAISRTNHANQSGSGKIATIRFKLADSVSIDSLSLFPYWVHLVDNLGNLLPVYNSPRHTLTVMEPVVSTGINRVGTTNTIQIYPNPANSTVYVVSEATAIKDIAVYDILGKQVLSVENTGTKTTQLDISGLSAGTYIIKVSDNKSIVTWRLIVE